MIRLLTASQNCPGRKLTQQVLYYSREQELQLCSICKETVIRAIAYGMWHVHVKHSAAAPLTSRMYIRKDTAKQSDWQELS